MSRTDAEDLEKLRLRRDKLEDALAEPETVSAYGGMPDAAGSASRVGRMGGRAQLQSELDRIRAQIKELEEVTENGPYVRESRGVT
jgi:aspartate aminotransferase-like enzyme